MKNIFGVAVLIIVGIVGSGFYLGWFQLSTDTANQRPSATITVDKAKMQEDEQKAKDKLHGLVQDTEEKAAVGTDKAKEPQRQP
jgi:predicted negative regulator of RcsB-dependent stress response